MGIVIDTLRREESSVTGTLRMHVHDGLSRTILPVVMAKRNQSPPRSFEDALKELELILNEIEGGQVGLEESLLKYERGNFLILHCRGVLNRAEKQIEMLSRGPEGDLNSERMEEIEPPQPG